MTHSKPIRRLSFLLAFILSIATAASAQQVIRINPAHITLRGVSLASRYTAIIVGDSGYAAISHDAATSDTSWGRFAALPTGISNTTTLYCAAFLGDSLHAAIGGEHGTLATTSDGGVTWSIHALGTSGTIRALAWNNSLSTPAVVAVGDSGVTYRSTDLGQSWVKVASPTTAQLNAVTFGTPYAGMAAGGDTTIIQTKDGGATWSVLPFPYDYTKLYGGVDRDRMGSINFCGVAMRGADTTWVAFDSACLPVKIVRGRAVDNSIDFEQTAHYVDIAGVTTYPTYTGIVYVGMHDFFEAYAPTISDYLVAVPDNNDIDDIAYGATLVGDADGTPHLVPFRFRAAGVFRDDTTTLVLSVGDDMSICRYLWTPHNVNGSAPVFNQTWRGYYAPGRSMTSDFLDATLQGGTGYVLGTSEYLYRTSNYGLTWDNLAVPITHPSGPASLDSALNTLYMLDSTTLFLAGWSGILLRYDKSGFHFLQSGTIERLHGIVFPLPDTGIVVGDNGTILRSTDRGQTWSLIPTTSVSYLHSVAFSGAVGITTGDQAEILRSTDYGATWNKINHPLSGTSASIRQVQGFADGTFIARADTVLMRSTDFGSNWEVMTSPGDSLGMSFFSPKIGVIAERATSSTELDPDTAFLLYTTDGGSQWSPVTIPFLNFGHIVFQWLNEHEVLLFGCYGMIVQFDISTNGVTVIHAPFVSEASVYPNPTTRDFHINYFTKATGPVTIHLFSEDGKDMGTLFSGKEPAGTHEQSLTAPSGLQGTYFIKVSADGTSATAKLTLQ